jgi:hypothetical protein
VQVLAIAAVLAVLSAAPAVAVPIVVTVGDNDGYGLGVPDNATGVVWPGPPYDGRSASEAAASNGAQITDVYSAIFPAFGPNPTTTASVIFPFPGVLASGTLVIDMGDFESSLGGAILANVNGVALPFAFDDGFQNTVVRSFPLSAPMITAANGAGQVVLNLDHVHPDFGDLIAFDYFQLQGDAAAVPEPATLTLLGMGLGALALRRRRKA